MQLRIVRGRCPQCDRAPIPLRATVDNHGVTRWWCDDCSTARHLFTSQQTTPVVVRAAQTPS